MQTMNKVLSIKISTTILICFLILISISSCNKDKLIKEKDNTKDTNNISTKMDEEEELFQNNNLLNEMTVVNLYFVNPKEPKLSIEKREVLNLPDNQQMLKQVLSTLSYGPLSKLRPSIPSNFTIIGTFIVNKTAFVNIKKTEDNNLSIGGVESEQLLLYSIVNTTLALNNSLDNVKILLNGEEAETLLGHISTSGLFNFNEDIVIK